MALRNAVQLICYPNRLGANLKDLSQVLDRHLADAIGGVHILSLFPSSVHCGFSPLSHREVAAEYATWADFEAIAGRCERHHQPYPRPVAGVTRLRRVSAGFLAMSFKG